MSVPMPFFTLRRRRRLTAAPVGLAVVLELRAGLSLVAVGAAAVEVALQGAAAPAVAARRASAAVPLQFAVAAREARRADALVPSGRALKQARLL